MEELETINEDEVFAEVWSRCGDRVDDVQQKLRQAVRGGGQVFAIAAAIVGALVLVLLCCRSGMTTLAALAGAVIAGIAGVFRWHTLHRMAVAEFKNAVVPAVLQVMAPDMKYSPGGCIPCSKFHASGLFPYPDRYRGEDYFKGSFRGVELGFSEVNAEKKHTTTSKGQTRTYYTTIFKGIYMIADFHKNFRFDLLVVPDVAERSFGSLVGNFLQKMNVTRSGRLMKMEDPEFEKYFAVYGRDEIETRYILSPAMMRRMLELRGLFRSDMFFAFVDSRVHIAIKTGVRDFFEPAPKNPEFALRRLIHELAVCLAPIIELRLNIKIWSKE